MRRGGGVKVEKEPSKETVFNESGQGEELNPPMVPKKRHILRSVIAGAIITCVAGGEIIGTHYRNIG